MQKAITKGYILEANELGDRDELNRIVRLPNTPKIIIRTKGNRTLNEIPPFEIIEVMELFSRNNLININDKETLFRNVLEYYGFGRMTQKAQQILNAALKVAQQKNKQLGGHI